MISLLSDGICFHVLFGLEMTPFKLSKANTLFGESESVVPRKNILPLLNNLQIMLFPHFPERLISGGFIILHVNVPSVSKFDKLVPLDMFNLIKFHFLSKLGLPHLFSQLDLRKLLEFNPSLFGIQILHLYLLLLVVVTQNPQKCCYLEVG